MSGDDVGELIRPRSWSAREAALVLISAAAAAYFEVLLRRPRHPGYVQFAEVVAVACFLVVFMRCLGGESNPIKLTAERVSAGEESYRWKDVIGVGIRWDNGSFWPLLPWRHVYLLLREDVGYDDDVGLNMLNADGFEISAEDIAERLRRRVLERTGRQLEIQRGPFLISNPAISKAWYYVAGMAVPLIVTVGSLAWLVFAVLWRRTIW